MSGFIRMVDSGIEKSFTVDFAKDIFLGCIFTGRNWESIEKDIVAEDKVEAKKLYEESRKEWLELTKNVGLKF